MSGQSTPRPKAEDATIKCSDLYTLKNPLRTISLILGFDAAVNKSTSRTPNRFGKPDLNLLLSVPYVLTQCCNF